MSRCRRCLTDEQDDKNQLGRLKERPALSDKIVQERSKTKNCEINATARRPWDSRRRGCRCPRAQGLVWVGTAVTRAEQDEATEAEGGKEQLSNSREQRSKAVAGEGQRQKAAARAISRQSHRTHAQVTVRAH